MSGISDPDPVGSTVLGLIERRYGGNGEETVDHRVGGACRSGAQSEAIARRYAADLSECRSEVS